MEFTYSFVVNSRPSHNGTIRLPLVNGMVKFGQFRPEEILNKNFQHPAIVGITHYETAFAAIPILVLMNSNPFAPL